MILKKLFTSSIILSLFFVSNFTVLLREANAQDTSSSAQTKNAYVLTYPGILPDSPLYKLKVLRDKLSYMFITDPRNKISFDLLQTDKGILAASILVDKQKIDLAKETALKAENNFTLLDNEIGRLPKKPDDEFFDKLQAASMEHQRILESIIARVPANQQTTFKTVLGFSKSNLDTLMKYKNKNALRWNQE